MKKAILLVFYIGLMKINSIAQQIEMPVFTKVKSESIANQKQALSLNLSCQPVIMPSCILTKKAFQQIELKSLPSGVHYDAFFCKMEVQVLHHLNIWIKVRVGNFDDYEKEFWTSK